MKTISEIAKNNLIKRRILPCCWRQYNSTHCAGSLFLVFTFQALPFWAWLCSFWLFLFAFAWTGLLSSNNFFKFGQIRLCSLWFWLFECMWCCRTSKYLCPFSLTGNSGNCGIRFLRSLLCYRWRRRCCYRLLNSYTSNELLHAFFFLLMFLHYHLALLHQAESSAFLCF